MFNQLKRDFALCKAHIMESSNRRIPIAESGFCMILSSDIEQRSEKDFYKVSINAMRTSESVDPLTPLTKICDSVTLPVMFKCM